MSQLPLIVGFGGINPAGRASFHHAYRRLVLDALDSETRSETILSLASLMNLTQHDGNSYINQSGEAVAIEDLVAELEPQVLNSTLIRRIEPECFDVNKVTFNRPASATKTEGGDIKFRLRKRQLPANIPDNWQITELGAGQFEICIADGNLDVIFPDHKTAQVQAAGQLPSGFKPGTLYQSRNHPRNLQMTVFGASDALHATGIPFDEIAAKVRPDQIGVYASNSIGQLDDLGFGGLTKYPSIGKRTTSKQMPLGYAQMPADFINAYILGSVGVTGGALGACATFLYNLRSGVNDIRSGRRKVVLVGGSDAPVIPEVIEGFRAMGALAEDKDLLALDQLEKLGDDDYRRACRPFGQNCGFTIGEGAQFLILMDDALAVEMGASVLGSIADVYTNADGIKKSITAPGPGNYITMAKSVALAKNILGEEALQKRSFILAHGSSTPQNRVTESLIYDRIADSFDINDWPVAAPKAFVGHTIGPASGDQITMALGVFAHNIMPGISTIDKVAEDVYDQRLNIATEHWQCQDMDIAFINSKGFGGNNATATLFSPKVTLEMMEKRHGAEVMADYREKLTTVEAEQKAYQEKADNGQFELIYRFGVGVIDESGLELSQTSLSMPGFKHEIDLPQDNPFEDMV